MDYLLCGNLPYPAWKKHISVQNLSNRRIRRYLVCRLKRPEARDFSHVRFTIYLERSSGPEDFYSYKKWENVDYNTASLYMSKELKVEKGYYYRLRGYHSCTKSGVTENGGSSTNGIYIG